MAVYLGYDGDAERCADRLRSLLTSGDDGPAPGQLLQQGPDIRCLYHLEMFVRGIVLQAPHGCGGVEEGESFLLAETDDLVDLEPLGLGVHEVVPVAKEYLPLDAPVVVDEVGVVDA